MLFRSDRIPAGILLPLHHGWNTRTEHRVPIDPGGEQGGEFPHIHFPFHIDHGREHLHRGGRIGGHHPRLHGRADGPRGGHPIKIMHRFGADNPPRRNFVPTEPI